MKTIKDLSPEQQAEVLQIVTDVKNGVICQGSMAYNPHEYTVVDNEHLARLISKAAILDELIELRGMATRGPYIQNHEEGGLISAYGSCDTTSDRIRMSIIDCLDTENEDAEGRYFYCDGERHANAQAITEIMNKLEELK